MAKKRQRFFALFLAILFFVVSFGYIALEVWQSSQSNSADNTTNTTPTNTATTTNTTSNTTSATKLAGTKMTGFTPVASVPTLKITDLTVGTGPAATSSSNVTVNYTGAVAATGIVFQSSYDVGQTATFSLSQVIVGWQKGIPGMKAGGTRRLLIPADEAYGASPPSGSGIPANAALVFDVSMVKIN
jgi:FKBP-type peptidyl-prolyl cis-trans isomerase